MKTTPIANNDRRQCGHLIVGDRPPKRRARRSPSSNANPIADSVAIFLLPDRRERSNLIANENANADRRQCGLSFTDKYYKYKIQPEVGQKAKTGLSGSQSY